MKLDPYCELQVLDLFQQELQKKQRSIPKDKLELREVGSVSDAWESRCDFYAAIYRSGQLEIIQAALEEAKSRQRVFIEDNDLQVGGEGEEGEEEEDDDAEDEVVDPVVKKPRIHWAKREGQAEWTGNNIMSYLWNLWMSKGRLEGRLGLQETNDIYQNHDVAGRTPKPGGIFWGISL